MTRSWRTYSDADKFLSYATQDVFDLFNDNTTTWILRVSGLLKGISEGLDEITDPWLKIDDNIKKASREAGLNLQTNELINNILMSTKEKDGLNKLLGVDINKYSELQKALSNAMNKSVQLGRGTIQINGSDKDINSVGNYAALDMLFGESGTKLAQYFMDFGLGIEDAGEKMSKLIDETREAGLSAKKVGEEFNKHIAKASSYTFKNGLDGLKRMAETSAEVNLNMENAFNFAKKLNGKNGLSASIETGAHLQVLGGSFMRGSNPLEMFYEATSDVEALQKRIITMFQGLGQYKKGEGVTYSRENRMYIQAAAEQMGLNPDEIFTMINTKATKDEIGRQARGKFSGKDLELLQNTATLENGNLMVSVNGVMKGLSELEESDLETIRKERSMAKDTGMTLVQIAQDLRSIKEKTEAGENEYLMGAGRYISESMNSDALLDVYKSQFQNFANGILNMSEQELAVMLGGGSEGLTKARAMRVRAQNADELNNIDTAQELFNVLKEGIFRDEELIKQLDLNGDLLKSYKAIEYMAGNAQSSIADIYQFTKELPYREQGYENDWNYIDYYFEKQVGQNLRKPIMGTEEEDNIAAPHAYGGAMQPATSSAKELVTNGGFANNYYNNLGPTVSTQWGPEKMLTEAHAMGNSIGMNEYVLSSKALLNMGDGDIETGKKKADMINFGGVKPFATGGEIKISEGVHPYGFGGAMAPSITPFTMGGNFNLNTQPLNGRITLALDGASKTRDFDIKANADNIYDAVADLIERRILNQSFMGNTINNPERYLG